MGNDWQNWTNGNNVRAAWHGTKEFTEGRHYPVPTSYAGRALAEHEARILWVMYLKKLEEARKRKEEEEKKKKNGQKQDNCGDSSPLDCDPPG